MKLVILGALVTALIAASPTAFAQQTSNQQMKSSMSHARKHEGKTVGAKPSTADTDNTSVPGASVDKDDTTPKAR